MSSPLDRIEATEPYVPGIAHLAWEDFTALVNVAKAAEEAAGLSRPTEAQMHALREALAAFKEPSPW